MVAATGNQGSTFVWDLATGRQLQKLQNDGASYDLAFSPDGTALVAGSSEQIWTWRLR
jgi:WD40 repeat protein